MQVSINRNHRIDVTKYGAQGDGITDNHDAIMEAYDDSSFLFFPPGSYATSPLTFKGQIVDIMGSGFYPWYQNESTLAKTVIQSTAQETGTIGENALITIESADPDNEFIVGNHISDLSIDGKGYEGGLCINWDGNPAGYINNNVYERLGIHRAYGYGIAVKGYSFRNTFRDIVITDNTPSITQTTTGWYGAGACLYNGESASYNLFQGIDCMNTRGFMILSNGGWVPSYRDISGDGLIWNDSYGAVFDNITVEQCYDPAVLVGEYDYLGYNYLGNAIPVFCNRPDASSTIIDLKVVDVDNGNCNVGVANHAENVTINLSEKTSTTKAPKYPLALYAGSGNIDNVEVPASADPAIEPATAYMGVQPKYNFRLKNNGGWTIGYDPRHAEADLGGSAPSLAVITAGLGSPSATLKGWYSLLDTNVSGKAYRVYCDGSNYWIFEGTKAT